MGAHDVEAIKRRSRHLRGSLRESLADQVTGALAADDQTLIKYHGSYQQDDRDLREERRRQKLEPAHAFMIRTRTPGGVVTPSQWLQLDRIATTFAERGLRITTRQAFQLHGVVKRDLKPTLQAINDALIDTLAACGDVNRNVAVAANPRQARVRGTVQALAAAVSDHLLPQTRAYYELWLDEECIAGGAPAVEAAVEPLYGDTYLPRKFKIGFAVPPDNDVDVFAQDLGFIAIVEHGAVVGYNVVIGGGMGATHGDPQTYPRLADVIGFVAPGDVLAVAVAVMTVQRDWGNRIERKRARLKYTIDDRGLDRFTAEVERRAGLGFAAARLFEFTHNGDRFGWTSAAVDGDNQDRQRWQLTLRVIAGRLQDGDGSTRLTGLREIAALLQHHSDGAHFRLTANQNVVIANIEARLRARIDALVAAHGLDTHVQASPLRRNAIACVALPTCGLAMAEAERYLPDFIGAVERLLERHGLGEQAINLRISGCPNGCSRPYLGEIALVGKAPGRYNLMLGADHRGQRLNVLHRENIDEAEILSELDPMLARYTAQRIAGEYFGDFLLRSGMIPAPRTLPLELVA